MTPTPTPVETRKTMKTKWQRPWRIILTVTDPFDGAFLGEMNMRYNRRKSADGFYSRRVKMLRDLHKTLDSKTLQGRTPRVAYTSL